MSPAIAAPVAAQCGDCDQCLSTNDNNNTAAAADVAFIQDTIGGSCSLFCSPTTRNRGVNDLARP